VCDVKDEVSLDFLYANAGGVLQRSLAGLARESLSKGPSGVEFRIESDIRRILERCRSISVDPSPMLEIPLLRVFDIFEAAVGRIDYSAELVLSSFTLDNLDSLFELLVNPLRESSWGLDRHKRKVKAWSRVARACREHVQVALSTYDHSALSGLSAHDLAKLTDKELADLVAKVSEGPLGPLPRPSRFPTRTLFVLEALAPEGKWPVLWLETMSKEIPERGGSLAVGIGNRKW
jgi:hypothetical protein